MARDSSRPTHPAWSSLLEAGAAGTGGEPGLGRGAAAVCNAVKVAGALGNEQIGARHAPKSDAAPMVRTALTRTDPP